MVPTDSVWSHIASEAKIKPQSNLHGKKNEKELFKSSDRKVWHENRRIDYWAKSSYQTSSEIFNGAK